MKITQLIALILLCTACSKNDRFTGSGQIIQQDRVVDSFTKVNSISSIAITIMEGSAQSIEVSADDNIINNVKTVVDNGVLQVSLAQGNYNDVTIDVSIMLPDLERLENIGSGNMTISGFTDLNNLTIDNHGSGTITASGSGNTLSITNSGSGNYKGFNLRVKDCLVTNSGSANCEITCSDNLNGTNSGSGSVFYKGTASVDMTNSGSGEIVDSN